MRDAATRCEAKESKRPDMTRELEWRTVDRKLRVLAKRRCELDAVEARWLREAVRLELWVQFGMVSMRDYMDRVLDHGPKTARERLRVAEALGELPLLAPHVGRGGDRENDRAGGSSGLDRPRVFGSTRPANHSTPHVGRGGDLENDCACGSSDVDRPSDGSTMPKMRAARHPPPTPHVGRLDREVVRSQAKDALVGSGWKPSVARAAVDAALAETNDGTLESIIVAALRSCLLQSRGSS